MNQELPPDHSHIWMHHMRRGEYAAAWNVSDAVLKARNGKPCWHLPRHLQYVWNGATLNEKRVLIRCYHGLGDTIQFIRYAPLVKAIAAEVIVWAQQPLLPLLQTVNGMDRLLALHDGTPEVPYDVDVEIMELPHVFRTTLATIPAQVPYIQADAIQFSPSKRPVIGLVWQAGDWDERRSIPFSLLKPLFTIPNITFYILQMNARAAGWQERCGIYPGDFTLQHYASIIKGLDLLISVDSMPAHLAGALGVPVWALLHAEADWRWMNNRADSPWYPTMRLFRQMKAGDWESVIKKVKDNIMLL